MYVRPLIKFHNFVLIGHQRYHYEWHLYLYSDWLKFQKSPQNPLGQMETNFTGSIYERSFIKFPHFVLIWLHIWGHGQFLFLIGWRKKKLFSPETAWPDRTNLGRKHLHVYKNLHKVSSFIPDPTKIWPPWMILNFDWLKLQKSSPLKPLGRMQPNYIGSIHGRSCIFPYIVLLVYKYGRHMSNSYFWLDYIKNSFLLCLAYM